MRLRLALATLFALLLGGLLAPPGTAAENGEVLVVVDAQWTTGESGPLTKAKIRAINLQTGQSYPAAVFGDAFTSNHYEATQLPFGTYIIEMSAPGFASQYWPQAYSAEAAQRLLVQPSGSCPVAGGLLCGPSHALTATLHQSVPLSVRVQNRSGAPVSGVPVTATRAEESTFAPHGSTDATGRVRLDLPPGDYQLTAPNGRRTVSEDVTLTSATTRSMTLLDSPGAPGQPTVALLGRDAVVSWSRPDDDGGSPVTGYVVRSHPGGTVCATDGQRTCTVTGLSANTSYTFSVHAENVVGAGPEAAARVVPAGLPTAPRDIRARAGNRSALLRWSQPADNGGSPVLGYTAVSYPGGKTCQTDGRRSCWIKGLTNGTPFSFTVKATTRLGDGPASPGSATVTPRASLGAPGELIVEAPAGLLVGPAAVLRWTAPGAHHVTVMWRSVSPASSGYRARSSVQDATDSLRLPRRAPGTSWSVTLTAANRSGKALSTIHRQFATAWRGQALRDAASNGDAGVTLPRVRGSAIVVDLRGSSVGRRVSVSSGPRQITRTVKIAPGGHREVRLPVTSLLRGKAGDLTVRVDRGALLGLGLLR